MSNPYETAKEKNTSVIGPTLKFKGELSAEEDLLIEGQIEGTIKHTSNLTIGKEGKVKANVSAEYIAVEGTVEGDLKSSQSVTIHESANIDGNIFSPTVSLLEGATFNGTIDMTGKTQAQSKPKEGHESHDKGIGDPVSVDQPEDVRAAAQKKATKPRKQPSANAA